MRSCGKSLRDHDWCLRVGLSRSRLTFEQVIDTGTECIRNSEQVLRTDISFVVFNIAQKTLADIGYFRKAILSQAAVFPYFTDPVAHSRHCTSIGLLGIVLRT